MIAMRAKNIALEGTRGYSPNRYFCATDDDWPVLSAYVTSATTRSPTDRFGENRRKPQTACGAIAQRHADRATPGGSSAAHLLGPRASLLAGGNGVGQLAAPVHTDLVEDGPKVLLDGVWRHVQLRRDLLVGLARRNTRCDRLLACSQCRQSRGRGFHGYSLRVVPGQDSPQTRFMIQRGSHRPPRLTSRMART